MCDRKKSKIIQVVTVILAALVLSCSCGQEDSPEEQIRRYVRAGEDAAEGRDIRAVRKLISERYGDEQGRTRQDIVAITARYFFSSKNIHIFTRIGELTFPDRDRANLLLYVAMAGQNISDLDAFLNMQGDLYRFDLVLGLEDDEWKLFSAGWRRAGAEDFF